MQAGTQATEPHQPGLLVFRTRAALFFFRDFRHLSRGYTSRRKCQLPSSGCVSWLSRAPGGRFPFLSRTCMEWLRTRGGPASVSVTWTAGFHAWVQPHLSPGYFQLPLQCSCKPRERGTQALPTTEQLPKHTPSLARRAGRQCNYSHSRGPILLNCPVRRPPSRFLAIINNAAVDIGMQCIFGANAIKKEEKNLMANFKMPQVKANCFPSLLGCFRSYASY